MRPPAFSSDTVVTTLQRLRVASMSQLVAALGAPSVRTVFRKLRQVDCLTSYSHGGQYYACAPAPASTPLDCGAIRAFAFPPMAPCAPRGYWCRDLEALVGVNPTAALRHLVHTGSVARVAVDGRFLYCAAEPARRQAQLAGRRAPLAALRPAAPATAAPPELAAAWLGLQPKTVRKGRRELACGQVNPGRVRQPGGGRKPAEKKHSFQHTSLRSSNADAT